MQYLATLGQHLCLGKIIGAGAAARIEQKLQLLEQVIYQLGTIHLRRQHVLGGRGFPLSPCADVQKVTVHKDKKSPS